MSLKEQVAQAKAGDKSALLELVMARERELYGLSYVYLRNEQDASDALQDMIVILFTRIHTLKKEEAFYSWTKQILVRCCLTKLRSNKRWTSIPEGHEETTVLNADTGMDLLDAIHQLPDRQRDVILLYYYDDRSFEEIAEILQCPVGTVKSRLHQALKRLKGRLGDEYREQA